MVEPGDRMPRNLLTQWARLLIGSLAGAGVRQVIVSPGSRSTPLTAAVLERPDMDTTCVIDERSAGFIALGQAKLSGDPTLLICTSGSAAAHYFPALIEADESATPLIVLSADRPTHLQLNRAPQTIEQAQLFGRKVRAFMDLGTPAGDDAALRGLARKAVQAVSLARFPHAGPVHLNFPAAKPLEPVGAESVQDEQLQDRVSALLRAPVSVALEGQLTPGPAGLAHVVELARAAKRPLIVVGPRAPHETKATRAIADLAESCRWPVYAEPASQLRQQGSTSMLCEALDGVWRTPRARDYVPDFVLQFGHPATSGAWSTLLTQNPQVPRAVVCESAWSDPHNCARLVLRANEYETAARLTSALPPADPRWLTRLKQANQVAQTCIRDWLGAQSALDPPPEACHVQTLLRELLPGDLLVVGNSLPIRLLDTVCEQLPADVRVLSQRGANGIDGLVSLAVGAACSQSTGRAVLLLGDVSALHDMGGLCALSARRPELSCVILNNGGGRIFEHLPIAGHPRLEAWTTPHDVRLYELAQAFRVPGVRVDGVGDLRAALALGRRDGGPLWIEALCQPDGARRMYSELTQQITQALPPES